MKDRLHRVFLAIGALFLTTLACSVLGGGALLKDDFSDSKSGWGTGTDKDSSVEYSNNALDVSVNKDLYFVWSTPTDEDYENIHMEVTAFNHSTDSAGAFGIICN